MKFGLDFLCRYISIYVFSVFWIDVTDVKVQHDFQLNWEIFPLATHTHTTKKQQHSGVPLKTPLQTKV